MNREEASWKGSCILKSRLRGQTAAVHMTTRQHVMTNEWSWAISHIFHQRCTHSSVWLLGLDESVSWMPECSQTVLVWSACCCQWIWSFRNMWLHLWTSSLPRSLPPSPPPFFPLTSVYLLPVWLSSPEISPPPPLLPRPQTTAFTGSSVCVQWC